MNLVLLRQVMRHIILFLVSPKTFLIFVVRCLRALPCVNVSTDYLKNKTEKKLNLQKKGLPIGHASGSRFVSLSFFGRSLFRIIIPEGFHASADQFYINRPIADMVRLLKIAEGHCTIRPNDVVFEPGCGAGRHLQFLLDKYRCSVVGLDVHAPAIKVASVTNIFNGGKFYLGSCLDEEVLKRVIPQDCSYVVMNSFLNHVCTYPGFEKMIEVILSKTRFVLIIINSKYNIKKYFVDAEILLEKVEGTTRFAVIRGV